MNGSMYNLIIAPEKFVVVRSGGLSNHDLPDLLHSLTNSRARKEPQIAAIGGWPDDRRSFGSVRDAIVEVLTAAPEGLRPRDVHAEIERRLGQPVSRHSVNDMLRVRSTGTRPLFVRVKYGWYKLAHV